MKLKRTGSLWNRDNRNGINSNWERLETVFKNVDKLVIEGKLTPDEYAEIIASLNGLLKSGNVDKSDLTQELRSEVDKIKNKIDKGAVSVSDIDKNKGKLDQTYLSEKLLQQMAGNTPINAVPADGSVNNRKLDSIVYGKILDIGTNANSLDVPGFYTVSSGERATEELNFPPGNQLGVLNVRDLGLGVRTQTYTMHSNGEIWTRRRYNGNWSSWIRVGDKTITPVAGDNDLDLLTSTGQWKQIHTPYVTNENNYPPISGEFKGGILNVVEYGGAVTQTYVAERAAEMWVRDRSVRGKWFEWKRLDGNVKPVTRMEVTGKWTPNDDGDRFLLEMGEHELVETIEIGRTVNDRPLYAAIIGDKTKPALLVNAGAHGTEVGPPEGAWLWVRELTKSESLIFMDMCIIVVPNQNPDNRFIARGNKNAVDLNRDWVDFSQPETQAVKSLFDNYNVVAGLDMHNFGYPRDTSLQEVTFGSNEVKTKSQEMYDAVFSALENDNQPVRRYDPAMDERSFTNGVAIAYDIPTLIIEIPCGGYNDWTFDHYIPTPSWQSHIFILTCDAVANYVWRNLSDFEAVKSE